VALLNLNNATDLYELRYAEFVVSLVKAVQEQEAHIEKLSRQVEQNEIMPSLGNNRPK
jgi:hypothetical protein